MAQFKDREEYEKWKAERQRHLAEKNNPEKKDRPSEGPRPDTNKGKPSGSATAGLLPIEDLFRDAWEVYRQRVGPLIALYLFAAFSSLAVVALFGGAGFLLSFLLPAAKGPVIAAAVFIGIIAAVVVMSWGMAAVILAVTDSGLGIRDALSKGSERIGAFFWLLSTASFIITGGFLLLIVPGVIFLVWFAFGQFILAEEDERGMNALLKSREYVRGYWFEVFLRLFLVWIASAIASAVPFAGPLLALAFLPYTMIYLFTLYQDLKRLKGDLSFVPSTGSKLGIIGLGTLGYLLVPLILVALMGASVGVCMLVMKGIAGQLAMPPR